MLSLDSVDNYENLLKFDERVKKLLKTDQEIEYVCEWKIDGLSVSLVYQNHQLVQISTRGNGEVGEDVTFNKELIKNIPFTLPETANCEVRGEIYMKKDEFFRLNKELEKIGNRLLANPRNAASGSLRTLIPLQNRKLNFFAYQLLNIELDSQITCLKKLEKLGFVVSPNYQLCKGIEKTKEFIQKYESKRENLDFESDGIVIKVNNYDFYQLLGQTKVSRNGRITYVAEIEPVTLQGSKINKVTLHNYSFIRNLKLNIGDETVIKKAEQKREELLKLAGFQKKSVDNILTSIENSKKKPLTNLLTALAILVNLVRKGSEVNNFTDLLPNLAKKVLEEELQIKGGHYTKNRLLDKFRCLPFEERQKRQNEINTLVEVETLPEKNDNLAGIQLNKQVRIKAIHFQKVTFDYQTQNKPILHHYQHTFTNQELNQLVGKNGTGKSTILYLLLGILTPQQGQIVVETETGSTYNLHQDLNLKT
ncbi:11516_t:CDS:2 [Ambispora leptoticha]|uniref:DNA ligase (NAD(+)) n=1 Tax=Ambispora leptoticha TaxID=144679 RepID=A0A9N8YQB6_9GLOM|nr:11516_t:CDS:2 [Ambispora leptoticha]